MPEESRPRRRPSPADAASEPGGNDTSHARAVAAESDPPGGRGASGPARGLRRLLDAPRRSCPGLHRDDLAGNRRGLRRGPPPPAADPLASRAGPQAGARGGPSRSERDPRDECRELLVLRPGRTERLSELANLSLELLDRDAPQGTGLDPDVFLAHGGDRQLRTAGGVHEGCAKMLAVGRVDERVRGEHRGESRKRAPRGEQQAAPDDLVPVLAQSGDDLPQPLRGQAPRTAHPEAEPFPGLFEAQIFRGVVRLLRDPGAGEHDAPAVHDGAAVLRPRGGRRAPPTPSARADPRATRLTTRLR